MADPLDAADFVAFAAAELAAAPLVPTVAAFGDELLEQAVNTNKHAASAANAHAINRRR